MSAAPTQDTVPAAPLGTSSLLCNTIKAGVNVGGYIRSIPWECRPPNWSYVS